MKKTLLEEELNKFKFLFGYDTSKTLSENQILVSEQATTTTKELGAAVKAVGADIKLLSAAEKDVMSAKLASKPIGGMKTADDLIKGIASGAIKGKELASAQQVIFKSTTNPKIIDGLAKNFAKAGKVEEWAILAKDQKKGFDKYMRSKGYGDAQIEAMKKEVPHVFEPASKTVPGQMGSVKKTGKPKTPGSPKNTARGKKLAQQQKDTIQKLGTWDKVKAHWAKHWKKYGITLGATALAYWLLFPGAEDVDATVDITNDNPNDVPPGIVPASPQTQYRYCPNFPMSVGCASEKIREMQNCLPATTSTGKTVKRDGYFGPVTAQALKDKGYSTTVTQEIYDKIKSECAGTPSPAPAPAPETIEPLQPLPTGQVPQPPVDLGSMEPQGVPAQTTADLGSPIGDVSRGVSRAQRQVDRAEKQQLRGTERRDRRAAADQAKVDRALLNRDRKLGL